MDFLAIITLTMANTTKREVLRRVLTYTIMVTAVLSLTTILLLLMLGYRYNQGDNNFVQGGLVQFNSQPTGASVRVGTADLVNRTRSKITLNPGDYKVRMTLDGYRDWSKNITVHPGTVLWLNYAHFVPKNPRTDIVIEADAIGSVAMLEQGRRIALLQDASKPVITTVVANDDDIVPKVLTVPETAYATAETHAFTLEKLSGDNKRLLVKHSYDAGTQWLVANLDDITKTYSIASEESNPITSIQFDPSEKSRAYVLYADGSIRRIELDSGRQSDIILSDVADFTLTSSGAIFYSTKSIDGMVHTGYLTKNKEIPRTVDTFKGADTVHIAAGKYFSVFYIATSVGAKTTLTAYQEFPESDSDTRLIGKVVKTVVSPSPVTLLSFKADARLVAIQQARILTTYDIDLKKQSDIAIKGATTDITKPIEWLNSFHFWDDSTGAARQYEFDGENQETITDVVPGFSAAYSQNKKYFYTIGKTEQGFALQRTRMTL
jgi:hypothetical protein